MQLLHTVWGVITHATATQVVVTVISATAVTGGVAVTADAALRDAIVYEQATDVVSKSVVGGSLVLNKVVTPDQHGTEPSAPLVAGFEGNYNPYLLPSVPPLSQFITPVPAPVVIPGSPAPVNVPFGPFLPPALVVVPGGGQTTLPPTTGGGGGGSDGGSPSSTTPPSPPSPPSPPPAPVPVPVPPAAPPAPAPVPPAPPVPPPPAPSVAPPVPTAPPPSATATPAPTVEPTAVPTVVPTAVPTATAAPTEVPTVAPTSTPDAPSSGGGAESTPTPTPSSTPVPTPTPGPVMVDISVTFPGSTLLSAVDMVPGTSVSKVYDVTNVGTLPFTYKLSTSGGTSLLWTDTINGLKLKITRGVTTVYDGSLQVSNLSMGVTLNPADVDTLTANVYLPIGSGNAFQGLSEPSITFTWVATE